MVRKQKINPMNRNITRLLSAFFVLIVFGSTWEACKQPFGKPHLGCGGPMVGNEPTSVMLIFSNVNNTTDVDTAMWTNERGNIVSSKAHLTLSANSSYRVRVMFLNINALPASSGYDVTPSVQKEGSSYLVCFVDSLNLYGNLAANLNWARQDMDNSPSPMPVGLIDSFWTGADSVCAVMATKLHHQYKVKNGDCAPGYIDIQALDTIYISPTKG